jgi:hypothetical protein
MKLFFLMFGIGMIATAGIIFLVLWLDSKFRNVK